MEGWWKMQYRISFEFRLTRRACWPGDGSDFYDHVNAVRGKIEAHEFVTDVRAITDFAESSLTFDFVLDAHGYQQAIPEAAWTRSGRGCSSAPVLVRVWRPPSGTNVGC